TLDLTKLDSGIGSGSLQMQTIVDEINQYFYYDPLLSTVSLGNLEDIRIASRTTNMVANGIFDFDFEVVNNSTVSSIFEVTTIDVYDNTATLVPGAVTTTLPMSMTVENGDRIRTNGISANFGAGAGGPYTLTATFKVTDIDGNVSTGIANFTIDDTPTGGPNIMNDRYVATSVAGSEITLNPPSSTVNYALAEIVDEDGLAVPTGSPGFLRIKGLRPTTGISIAELDSQEFGFTYSNGLKVPATNRRFSHFFGLNNLFVDDGTNKSVAARFEVEERISTNPNLFSIGRLARSASYVTSKIVGDETSISNLVFNANPLAGSTLTMNGQTFTFVAAATLPNHIQLGASLAATMGNITAALSGANAFTSGTVDKSTYADNGFDTLTITHRSPGTSGNYFTFSHSLIGGAQVSINSGAFLATNNGNLIGGTDKGINYTVNPNSYEISTGSSQVALDIIGASIATYTFEAAGSLPILSTTLAGYAGAIISFAAVAAKDARETYEKQQVLTDAFDQKLREGSGVNIDEEMARTVAYQNTYVASATIFSTTKRLFDVLLDSMRS
ncbi:MAG: hypothetical protein J0G32_08160, partial [Alphaproteobacteria bacterium]|nr:hypothetical protein [Alphaproteobacteria bacterium]